MSAFGTTYKGHTKQQPRRIRPLKEVTANIDAYLLNALSDPSADGHDDAELLFTLSEDTRTKVIMLAAGLMLKQRKYYPLSQANFGPQSAIEIVLRVLSDWTNSGDPLVRHGMRQAHRLIDQWVAEGWHNGD